MLGDFRYCSSSSESSDAEDDSDSSIKSDDYVEKLMAERKILEDKIREREEKLKEIQGTLKQLNEERKNLFVKRNELVTSSSEFTGVDSDRTSCPNDTDGVIDSEEHILPGTSTEPLNLDPSVQATDNEEEFDSDME